MKKTLLSMFVCGVAAFSCAAAEIIWVDGVSESGGWYDANKSSTTNADNMMCYAASASNLIAWWQNKLPGVPAGTPTDLDAIWAKYVASANNGATLAGNVALSLNWWLSGIYTPLSDEEGARHAYGWWLGEVYSELRPANGYYYDQCGLTIDDLWNFSSYNIYYDAAENVNYFRTAYDCGEVDLRKWMTEGKAISLGVANDAGTLAHALTLWGIEYDENKNMSKLYLTDSDDARTGDIVAELVEATVDKIGENGEIYFHTEAQEWQVGNTVYTRQAMYEEGTYIDHVYFLDPYAFIVTIPEPGTATLSLLALAGLAVHRRR